MAKCNSTVSDRPDDVVSETVIQETSDGKRLISVTKMPPVTWRFDVPEPEVTVGTADPKNQARKAGFRYYYAE